MIDNIKEILNVYFDELDKQTAFLVSVHSDKDQRFMSSVLSLTILANEVIKLDSPTEKDIRNMLMKLYLRGFDIYRGHEEAIKLRKDQEWMLLMIEKHLFSSYPVYHDLMSECERIHPFEETAQSLMDVFKGLASPLSLGDVWKIKGTEYLIGAPFANASDLWIHKLADLDKNRLPSFRLSELLPLRFEDLQLRVIAADPKFS
ncbi:hypothetical protein QQ008_07325 [Fulvivirgaceae bacterium BMA10]|uniref:Uncharacterized protein n=1 Tax=Splendidivirga corallicola TaxID=3051826 RepID=A0ABT8KNP1_9BACT|nr:hypothetical protein [Fulvivirgaceae bacterium BMA10]